MGYEDDFRSLQDGLYRGDPFAPVPKEELRDIYYTPGPERRQRCSVH